ncbi:hypothetical protein BC830DRAFT_1230590 [Chytriomyces sp. MP71]|nr:hypothetical protein BC830DRAFT_1230590 [Chytriomyces sp. MP71]
MKGVHPATELGFSETGTLAHQRTPTDAMTLAESEAESEPPRVVVSEGSLVKWLCAQIPVVFAQTLVSVWQLSRLRRIELTRFDKALLIVALLLVVKCVLVGLVKAQRRGRLKRSKRRMTSSSPNHHHRYLFSLAFLVALAALSASVASSAFVRA